MALCRQTGMDAEEYIRSGATMDTVRAAAVDFLIQHNGPVGARMSHTGKVCPLSKMYTLGSGFIPSANHAGGLRYHGMSSTLSQLYHDGLIMLSRLL